MHSLAFTSLRALLVAIVALLAIASSAFADSATLTVKDAAGNSDPAAGVGRTFTVTGNSAVPARLFVKVRPAGGAPCAPSAYSDSGTVFDDFYNDNVNGNFSFNAVETWSGTGTYTFCFWIASGENTPATPISQVVTFRGLTGTISVAASPLTVSTGQDATVTLTGSSEGPAEVYAKIRPAGGAPCAPTYDGDSGDSVVSGVDVNGSFTVSETVRRSASGSYVICAWLSSSTLSAGPQSATLTVAGPCVVPALSLGVALPNVSSALAAAGCSVGKKSYAASTRAPRGTLIRLSRAAGTKLPAGTAIGVVLSSGRPCIVPSARVGMRLGTARARLRAAGCTPGKVLYSKSRRARNTVVRFAPRSGARLSPRAVVTILLARR